MHHTLDPFIAAFIKSRSALGIYNAKSVSVVRPRLTDFSRAFGRRPLDQLTHRAVERWLAGLNPRIKQNSRAAYLISVRQLTRWMTAEGHIDRDPCAAIPPVKRVEPLPRSQPRAAVASMLLACRSDRERAIIWLEVGLGLRRMEVAGLRWEHYDERSQLLEVRQSKNGRERVLPVTDEVARALARIHTSTTGPVIASELDGAPISIERVGFLVSRIMRRAGVKRAAYDGISGHALRHTAASDVLDQSGDIRAVQEMLDHKSLATTSIYLKRSTANARLREAMGGRDYEAPEDDAA